MDSSTFLIGIVFSLALIASIRFNRRRTEDSTHPTWTLIVIRLCGKHLGRLQPTPQYRLYYSAADLASATDPNRTLSGADVEVIPDLCILLQRATVALSATQQSMSTLLSTITSLNLRHHAICITASFLPLLLELKRPVSRHPADIEEFMDNLSMSVHHAQQQVLAQAHCLFSIPVYRRQEHVVAVAAVGEWWSFQKLDRSSFSDQGVFNRERYMDLQDRDRTTWASANQEEDEIDLVDPIDTNQMKEVLRKESLEDKRARQTEERDARAKRRADQKDSRDLLFEQWTKYVNDTQPDDILGYSDDQINNYNRLRAACDSEWGAVWGNLDFLESDTAFPDDIELGGWSNVMRLGSLASEHYLQQIEMYLDGWVEGNPPADDFET
ncbi:hypothetical protein BDP27DRAFT_1432397 [Rhodocollybia butyracea]|uniref:Uncharacterized protein n=1 Tax=Rhodocollybia butyracea TaxID=206335 RepID=A0A9P5TXF4_9AGAR|nr:hypothetical protein BDP27DRAFT_1432397 [Rhodocollybia butyracea]